MSQTIVGHAWETSEWLDAEWPEEWRLTSDFSDFTLTLTPELLDELSARVHAVVNSYRDRELPDETGAAARAERVRVHLHCFPRKPAAREDGNDREGREGREGR